MGETLLEAQSYVRTRELIAREYGQRLAGPYVTISRQSGCSGFALGLLLAEILNDHAEAGQGWKVYGKEIMEQLATETNLAEELVEKIHARNPGLAVDLFRSMLGKDVPSGYEVRNRISSIIRGVAIHGRAILVGQGSAGATQGIENGLNVRLVAPEDWRAKRVAEGYGCTPAEAWDILHKRDQERDFLRKIYLMRYAHEPEFDVTYDRSQCGLAQIATDVVALMRKRGLV